MPRALPFCSPRGLRRLPFFFSTTAGGLIALSGVGLWRRHPGGKPPSLIPDMRVRRRRGDGVEEAEHLVERSDGMGIRCAGRCSAALEGCFL